MLNVYGRMIKLYQVFPEFPLYILCLGLYHGLLRGWSWGLRVWLPPRDAQPVTGPAESHQYPVRWPLLAVPPAIPEAPGTQHHAEPVQRQRHPAAVSILWPPVQPGSSGEPRHRAAGLCPVGSLWALQANRSVIFVCFAISKNRHFQINEENCLCRWDWSDWVLR